MFLLSSRADIFVAQNSTGYRDGDTVLDCLTSVVPRNDISCIFNEDVSAHPQFCVCHQLPP